ncbi:hypothetical protein AWB76_06332 [Caballeronia temeraria]|uniref:Lipoprotein n=2 Tax=Caballeronia temeraria TaxID=1777137 RepID=A0A158D1B9_9BURK|nr:hypothetical protein AWB76_06332 [Caballeronia temeraria]
MNRSILLMSISSALVSGCAGYKNAEQCEQKMADLYPSDLPKYKRERSSFSHEGQRVVSRGSYEVPLPKEALAPTLLKVRTRPQPVAMECTFAGEQMTSYQWLAPKKLVLPPPEQEE